MNSPEKLVIDNQNLSTSDIGLRDIIATILSRKKIILLVVLIFTLITSGILFYITPLYTAETLLMIESRNVNLTNIKNVANGLLMDSETIEGEIEVIRSHSMAESVIKKLNLNNDQEFNDNVQNKSNNISNNIHSEVIDTFRKRISISIKGRSRVISIKFSSENAEKATTIANTIAETYLLTQLETKYETTRRVTEWLSERVTASRKKVIDSEITVEKFRQKTGLLQGKETSLSTQQLTELNTQLILAKTARAESEARLNQSNKNDITNTFESSSEVLNSNLIQNLREKEADIQRKAAELSSEYGKKHPKMLNLQAESNSLKKKIKTEVDKIARGLSNEVGIAQAREASLQDSINKLKKQIAASSNDLIQLHTLERDAEANRALLKILVTRMKEAGFQEDENYQQADARIVSLANIPDKPSFPKKRPILILTIIGSTIIGLIIAFLLEHLNKGFRSGEEIEQVSGIYSLGFVPLITDLSNLNNSPKKYLLKHPKSAFGESINTLRWNITLPNQENPSKKILFTSTTPKEGKTTIAISFAIMHARAGKNVVVIDADCRLPRVDKALSLKSEPGLIEILKNDCSFVDAIQYDKETGVSVITAGKITLNPSDLLASNKMDILIEYLADIYDLVIIDSPPVLAASDAVILSRKIDTSVFVVRWLETKRESVKIALKQMQNNGGPIAGVLLSMVDVKKHSLYNYGDSSYYSGQLKNYYAE